MISDKDIRDVEAYLCNRLPETRKINFEKKLLERPELQNYLEMSKTTILGLNSVRIEKRIKRNVEEARTFRKKHWIKPISLAASIILVLFQALNYSKHVESKNELNNSLFDEFYQPFQNLSDRSDGGEECPPNELLDSIANGQLNESEIGEKMNQDTPCFSYYKGIAFMTLKNYTEASIQFEKAEKSKDINIIYESQWLHVLALIKTDPEKAKKLLKKIISDPNHIYQSLGFQLDKKIKTDKFSPFKFYLK